MTRIISFIFILLLGFCPLSLIAIEPSPAPGNAPEFIPVSKKPCYIGCDFQFQYCYHYNILNMNDAIKVKEWNVSEGLVTGKAAADIKAMLLIKMCYQVSLTSAFPVAEKEIDLQSEFEFSIKVNSDAGDMCISDEESTINFSTLELKGDIKTEPIPLMQEHLIGNMSAIIKDSVIKAVYSSVSKDKKLKNIYCGEGPTDTAESDAPCGCE
ncbi:MAG: hypothetical protein GX654_07195 [Desulfatiglans sp.]|jgi:hypothetical protein|nr:hypothetical protein [Desulfatiglans sp.]